MIDGFQIAAVPDSDQIGKFRHIAAIVDSARGEIQNTVCDTICCP